MSNIICPYCGKKLPDERFGCCDESSGHMMNITEAFEKQQKLCHGLGVPCFVLEECPMCGEFIFLTKNFLFRQRFLLLLIDNLRV